MSNEADDSLDLLIRVKSDTAGAAGATAALDEATAATDKGTAATGEATKATEKHSVGLHQMHRLFHALNEVVPGLGVVMQMAFSPVGAAISLAVMALSLFREHIKKVNEELDKMEAESAKPLTNRLEIMRESVIRNVASLAEYRERLADASRSHLTLADNIELAVAAMRKENQVRESLGEIGAHEELTVLETLHKAGLVSERQYAEMRLRIEQDLADKKRKLAEDELQAEINIRKEGTKAAEAGLPGLHGASEAARKRAEDAKVESEVKKSEMEIAKDNWKKAEEAVANFKKEHSSFSVSQAMHAAMFGGGSGAEEAKKDLAEYNRLKNAAARALESMRAAPRAVAHAETAATEADAAYRTAMEKEEQRRTLITKGQEETGREERELAARKKADAEISKAEHDAGKLKTPIGALAIEDAAKAEATGQAIEQHKPVRKEDAEQMREVGSAIAGHNVSLQTAVQMMHWARQNNETVVTTATRLADAMMGLVGDHSQLKGKVATLESHIAQLGRMTHSLPGN